MKIEITDYPNSYLKVNMEEGDSITTEKSSFILSSGQFTAKNILEIGSYKNLIAKIAGKSLSYVEYMAKQDLEMYLGPRDNSELRLIKIDPQKPILIRANSHFARTSGVELKLLDNKLTKLVEDGIWMDVIGEGYLVLKGYGKIIEKAVSPVSPSLIEVDALIAYEKNLDFKIIDSKIKDEISQILKSGAEVPFSIKGDGKVWLQSKAKFSLDD